MSLIVQAAKIGGVVIVWSSQDVISVLSHLIKICSNKVFTKMLLEVGGGQW